MKPIIRIGNYLQCPYCGKIFGNGISVVYSNIVMSCDCKGMTDAINIRKIKQK